MSALTDEQRLRFIKFVKPCSAGLYVAEPFSDIKISDGSVKVHLLRDRSFS